MPARRKPNVGILGGMGPAASAHFLNLFIKELQSKGLYEDIDFPQIMYLSLPLKDFGVSGAEDKASVAYQVAEGVQWLLESGAEVIAVPCNSVHEFYPFGAPAARILNIVDETLKRCEKGKLLGILCSRQTREAKLYETGEARVYVDQELVDAAIESVMRGKPASVSICLPNLDTVVFACTELSLISSRKSFRTIVDSSQCLAEALALRVLG